MVKVKVKVKVNGKGKGKVRLTTFHEGPKAEQGCTCTLSVTSAPDGVGG